MPKKVFFESDVINAGPTTTPGPCEI